MTLRTLIAAGCLAMATSAFAGGPVTPYTNDRVNSTGSGFDHLSVCRSKSYPLETRLRNCRAVIGVGHGRDFDATVEIEIGLIYTRSGQYDLAVAAYDQSLAWAPYNAGTILNDRCWAKALMGKDLDGARADCDAALKLKPDDAGTLDSAGMVEFKAGKLDAALADYEAALKADPKAASALFMRGIVKRRRGNAADGDADIDAAAKLDGKTAAEFADYGIAP